MRCRHPSRGRSLVSWRAGNGYRSRRIVCGFCGKCVSFGPANDAGCEEEIRAAEIAALHTDALVTKRAFAQSLDGAEIAGWIEHQYDSAKSPEQPGEHSGYLARCIATHAEDQ